MSSAVLERVEVGGLLFDIRPGTSDAKAIKEVVEKRGYARKRINFIPGANEHWVDLGANIGAFSAWVAKHDPSIEVDAYEPDPTMCELIEHNLRINGLLEQVTIHDRAVVADDRRVVVLHCNVARGNVWRNSIERDWAGGVDIKVKTQHIKSVLGRTASKKYVKIDIEGSEMPVLEWLVANPGFLPAGMAFEWSMDVDPSIARFYRVVDALEPHYENVKYGAVDRALETWPAEWFPPTRMVWCI